MMFPRKYNKFSTYSSNRLFQFRDRSSDGRRKKNAVGNHIYIGTQKINTAERRILVFE